MTKRLTRETPTDLHTNRKSLHRRSQLNRRSHPINHLLHIRQTSTTSLRLLWSSLSLYASIHPPWRFPHAKITPKSDISSLTSLHSVLSHQAFSTLLGWVVIIPLQMNELRFWGSIKWWRTLLGLFHRRCSANRMLLLISLRWARSLRSRDAMLLWRWLWGCMMRGWIRRLRMRSMLWGMEHNSDYRYAVWSDCLKRRAVYTRQGDDGWEYTHYPCFYLLGLIISRCQYSRLRLHNQVCQPVFSKQRWSNSWVVRLSGMMPNSRCKGKWS